MSAFRLFRGKKEKVGGIDSRSAEWVNRFYFLSAYFTGLTALLLIGYTIFGDVNFAPQSRERGGWDLSRPQRIDPRTIGH